MTKLEELGAQRGTLFGDRLLVIEYEHAVSHETLKRLTEAAQNMVKDALPGVKVMVIGDGGRVSNSAQLDRIEAKLDALVAALAEEDGEGGPTHDLEGRPVPPDRNPEETL